MLHIKQTKRKGTKNYVELAIIVKQIPKLPKHSTVSSISLLVCWLKPSGLRYYMWVNKLAHTHTEIILNISFVFPLFLEHLEIIEELLEQHRQKNMTPGRDGHFVTDKHARISPEQRVIN